MIRNWVNDRIAVPVATLLRTWVLNVVIGHLPVAPLRHGYYRSVCGMKIGAHTHIWPGARFTGDRLHQIRIGEHCSIPYNSFWVVGDQITIGDYVVLGHNVEFYTSDHDPDDPGFARRDAPINIHDRAWVGSRVMIMKGVTIGEGAVVAAGSLVMEDVPPYSIAAGRPAKCIRERGTREFTYQIDSGPWYL